MECIGIVRCNLAALPSLPINRASLKRSTRNAMAPGYFDGRP